MLIGFGALGKTDSVFSGVLCFPALSDIPATDAKDSWHSGLPGGISRLRQSTHLLSFNLFFAVFW
jgi:hypothetical protein